MCSFFRLLAYWWSDTANFNVIGYHLLRQHLEIYIKTSARLFIHRTAGTFNQCSFLYPFLCRKKVCLTMILQLRGGWMGKCSICFFIEYTFRTLSLSLLWLVCIMLYIYISVENCQQHIFRLCIMLWQLNMVDLLYVRCWKMWAIWVVKVSVLSSTVV